MKESPFRRLLFFLFAASWGLCGSFLLMDQRSFAATFDVLHAGLAKRIKAWTAVPEDRFFDDQTIFDYIDGAGEVYRAYNMELCLSRRYTAPGQPDIVLDIFDMGSSADAFGVFTHDRDGEELPIGQGALYRPGWLSFWKDRFFISIYAQEETKPAERAVRALGAKVADLIPSQGTLPPIISTLPRDGLVPKSVRYLHHPVVLNYHYYVSSENILHIGPRTEAVLAEYQRGEGRALLLLVSYPNASEAQEAHARYFRHFLPDAGQDGYAVMENEKWSTATRRNDMLAVLLESDSRQLAEDLLAEVWVGR
jgi:hypothetical protein